jgi:hypothetical protein
VAQSYFDANREADPPNGIHNHVSTREKLKAYDPMAYRLARRIFGENAFRWEPKRNKRQTVLGKR